MANISVIISSYNQKHRLRHCLESAVKMKCKYADSIEIIVADDNSTDGSIDLIKQYPVKLCLNKSACSGKYTLCENWNNAVSQSSGERVLFTNGDHILTTWFADNHMDPVMEQDIIFGPAFQTSSHIEPYILDESIDYKKLVHVAETKKLLHQDRRCGFQQDSAMTYNQTFGTDYPYGYNFSVLKEHFTHVGGFDNHRSWGGEEQILCEKIIEHFPHVKIKSNCNTVAIHMWHPPVNMLNRHTGSLDEYEF